MTLNTTNDIVVKEIQNVYIKMPQINTLTITNDNTNKIS